MKNDSILRGYTSMATAYKVDDYPYGFRLRTSIFYWIESKKGNGDRMGTYTINPKTGKPNKPKYTNYHTFAYLQLNEEGHVKMGVMDSYNMENFVNRFGFITDKIGEEYLSQIQKDNIRSNHFQHLRGNAPYIAAKYSEEAKPAYIEWVKATLKHIATCEFKDLVSYPEPPAQDQPDGEVKMITTQSYIIG